jgi:hypothetical protein
MTDKQALIWEVVYQMLPPASNRVPPPAPVAGAGR